MRNYAMGFRFSTRHTTHLIVSSKRVGNLVVITPTKKGNCSLRFKALVFLDFGVIHLSNYKMFLLQKVQRRICIGTMSCVFLSCLYSCSGFIFTPVCKATSLAKSNTYQDTFRTGRMLSKHPTVARMQTLGWSFSLDNFRISRSLHNRIGYDGSPGIYLFSSSWGFVCYRGGRPCPSHSILWLSSTL